MVLAKIITWYTGGNGMEIQLQKPKSIPTFYHIEHSVFEMAKNVQ